MSQYIDTSILAAYYCPEPLSEVAEKHLLKLKSPVISWLTGVELYSAIAKKVRRNDISENDAERIGDLFEVHQGGEYYRVAEIEAQDYRRATKWMMQRETPARTLDAIHLAVAWRLQLTVVTADSTMAQAAKRLDIKTEHLRKAEDF